MTTRRSLAEQIAQLEDLTYVDFDPEDSGFADETVSQKTEAGHGREHYIHVGPSRLRNTYDSISDPKYEGIKTSRRQLMDMERDPGDTSEESEQDAQESVSTSEGEDFDGPETHERAPNNVRNMSTTEVKGNQDDGTSTIQGVRESDRGKGIAIARQIKIWETLLDARIQLQKAMIAKGKLPVSQSLTDSRSQECTAAIVTMLREADELSRELIELQEDLLQTNQILTPPAKRRKLEANTDSLTALEDSLQSTSQATSQLRHSLHPYSLQTLCKWSAKVQAVAPSALLPANRNAFLKNSNYPKSMVELIDNNLVDQEKLLLRTRAKRSRSSRLGSSDPVEAQSGDVELFDDTDFYHQLLRDVIDSREDGPNGIESWLDAQRQRKEQKNVDTKASKGRKLRYEVHEKIQNFMVPIPVAGAWHEEQIDELFASLLGKARAASLVEPRVSSGIEEILKDGFRIFS